jgi:hypothetical protein
VTRRHRDKRLAEIVDIAAHRNELQCAQRDPLMERLIRGGTNTMRGFRYYCQ